MCGWHLFSNFQKLTCKACLTFLSPSIVFYANTSDLAFSYTSPFAIKIDVEKMTLQYQHEKNPLGMA